MSIRGAQASNFFTTGQPFTLVSNKYSLSLSGLFSISGSTLDLLDNSIPTVKYLNNSVTSAKIGLGTILHTNVNLTSLTGTRLHTSDTDATPIEDSFNNCALLDGTRPLTANWDVGAFQLQNLAEPTSANHAATKNYVDNAVEVGHWFVAPSLASQLQATWIRAGAWLYLNTIPAGGEQFTIHGVTFTFVAGAPMVDTEIQFVPADIPATVTAMVTAFGLCAAVTTDGIHFHDNFVAEEYDQYVILSVINEDPPDTPEDGNTKTISSATGKLNVAQVFHGGLTLTVASTGTICNVLDTGALNTYLYGTGWTPV